MPEDLQIAYERSLLCLPLLCGEEGVAVAAPEFDPEFIACGGYGYFWPRDGGEYVSGLIDAGYAQFRARDVRLVRAPSGRQRFVASALFFQWRARAQLVPAAGYVAN